MILTLSELSKLAASVR